MRTKTKEDRRARQWSLQKVSSIRDSCREDARKAVELAAKQALQIAYHYYADNNDSEGVESPSTRGKLPSLDELSRDSHSHSSLLSHEWAMRRGSKRGLFESTEIIEWSDGSAIGRDPNTVTESKMTSISGSSTNNSNKIKIMRKWNLLKRKRKSKHKTRHLTAEISKEAWMCGVCSKSFSSLEAAEKHEQYHIQEVVTDLGWDCRNNNSTPLYKNFLVTPTTATTAMNIMAEPPQTPEHKPNSGLSCPSFSSAHSTSQPRPDMLRMSTPALSSRVTFQPYNTPALQRKKRPVERNDSDDLRSPTDYDLPEEYGLTASIMRPAPTQMSPIIEKNDDILNEHDMLVPHGMKEYVVLADEALLDVCNKAGPMILTSSEKGAELELEWLAKDKAYYDLLSQRSLERHRGGRYSRLRTEGKTRLNKAQNKFVDAYQLMKEGKSKRRNTSLDHYNRKLKGEGESQHIIEHSKDTLYVNVIVKNSIKVVGHELERLAKERWEATQSNKDKTDIQAPSFQKFRAAAQDNLVKLAGMALASDFTPRRIAVQLSNDLYMLLKPRLKRRGVEIETEIEYRVGPFFVLGVNVKNVNWRRLVKTANRDVAERKSRWSKENEADEEGKETNQMGVVISFVLLCYRLTRMTKYEVLAQYLAWCYYFHWIIYTPICFILYHTFLGGTFRDYFLTSVADEIFHYVEEKGMEMDIGIRQASTQAAFMLSALRELRADGRELKKKQQEGDGAAKEAILGPLMGPAIKDDKGAAPPIPDGFEIPENLEFVGLELEVPVGFKRLRWAFLHSKSSFVSEAVFRAEAKYDDIQLGPWSKHDGVIGLPALPPDGMKEEDFIGAEKEMSYMMPKSAFVKANVCNETAYIEAYNDYCFAMKKKALTPDVPYGSTFIAWTKFVVINTGGDSCKILCSVEAEFPNGPPMVSRQIKSGMRAGVGELFVKIGETISKYADEYP